MGQLYDANALYDQDGTYDDGLPVPIVVPSKSSPLRLATPDSTPMESTQRFPFGDADPFEGALRMPLDQASLHASAFRGPWEATAPKESALRLRMEAAAARESAIRIEWSGTSSRASQTRLALDNAAARLSSMLRMPWAAVTGRQAATAVLWAAALARSEPTRLPWAEAIAKNAFVRLRWAPGYPYRSGYTLPFGGEPDLPPGSTIVIPPSEIYFMIPALSIVRDSDGADLGAIDASVKMDITTYANVLSATIPRQTLNLVDPMTHSEPVLVTCTINGYAMKFIIESYTDNRKFGGTGCKITGRSQTALLGAPYSPLSTFTSTANADASQLATNLMPGGFSLTWSTVDWLVPAGLFSYADLAPIDALALLVNAIGGTIAPDLTAQILTVNPLYPTSPWDWGSATPYADVPASFVAELAGQWQGSFKTTYNGIYVSGQNSGVEGLIKRTGSAGDIQLPPVTDPLIVHIDAARELGRTKLAQADALKLETLRYPLLPPGGSGNPGIFMPGVLIQQTELTEWAATPWRGQVMTNQIDAVHSAAPGSALSVRQTLTVERHPS